MEAVGVGQADSGIVDQCPAHTQQLKQFIPFSLSEVNNRSAL